MNKEILKQKVEIIKRLVVLNEELQTLTRYY